MNHYRCEILRHGMHNSHPLDNFMKLSLYFDAATPGATGKCSYLCTLQAIKSFEFGQPLLAIYGVSNHLLLTCAYSSSLSNR